MVKISRFMVITSIVWVTFLPLSACNDFQTENHSPTISSLTASPTSISVGGVALLSCSANDPDGDMLSYDWSAMRGIITGTGPTVNYTAPSSPGIDTVSVVVSDNNGGNAHASLEIEVVELPSTTTTISDGTSDFEPCWGKSSNPTSFPDTQRLLIATSPDGVFFVRLNVKLFDRGTVPDAVVLPDGKILVYFVAACMKENGSEHQTNNIVVAISEDAETWLYKKVIFNGIPSGATDPVDPNIVLMPNGELRLFTTIDPDGTGPLKARTYSFISTDGGITYECEGERFVLTNPDRDFLDPETFRFSDSNWHIWGGNQHVVSDDGYHFVYDKQVNFAPDEDGYAAIIAEITDCTSFYRMYVHGSSPIPSKNNWIKSLQSTDGNEWVFEKGERLTLDQSTGLESTSISFPTVVRLNNGTYLMVYETTIP